MFPGYFGQTKHNYAKDFGWRQMAREREKRATLEPLHRIAKALLPKLGVSQQNLLYYASLANFYTIHQLTQPVIHVSEDGLTAKARLRLFQAGGNADAIARLLSTEMARNLGQAMVVEAMAGAGGTLAAGDVFHGAFALELARGRQQPLLLSRSRHGG